MKQLSACICLFTLLSVIATPLLAQHTFERTFGGERYDSGNDVLETADHGFLLIGTTRSISSDTTDAWVIRTDARGDTLWTRSYGGESWDSGISVVQGTDEGFLLGIASRSFSESYDVYLVKIDDQGNTVWTNTYGGAEADYLHSMDATADGGYVMLAHTTSFGAGSLDFYLIRIDQDGDTLWTKTYGGTDYDWCASVKQTADGGYILVGETRSFGDSEGDVYVVKTDADGDLLWEKSYGDAGHDRAQHVLATPDNGYLVIGNMTVQDSEDEYGFALKIDANGDPLWTTVLGDERLSELYGATLTANDTYVTIGGIAESDGDDYDVYLTELDSNGDVITERLYGGEEHDFGLSVRKTSDNGYIIAGLTESFAPGKDNQVYLIKTDADGKVTGIGEHGKDVVARAISLHQNYPNPFNPTTMIRFTLQREMEVSLVITDAFGREVKRAIAHEHMAVGTHSVRFDASSLPSGVYFCRLEAPDVIQVRKMVLIR